MSDKLSIAILVLTSIQILIWITVIVLAAVLLPGIIDDAKDDVNESTSNTVNS